MFSTCWESWRSTRRMTTLRGAALWEEGLALAREIGDDERVGVTLSNLGYAELLQGEYERARTLSEEALTLARDLGAGRGDLSPKPWST